MNKSVVGALAFAAGSVIGTVIGGVLMKKKYEEIAEKEIAEVRDFYDQQLEEVKNAIEEEKKKEQAEYEQIIKDSGYEKNEEKGVYTAKGPYVIDPECLGDDEFEIECLTYYADGILADDMNYVIEDVEGTVGADFFTHFGEYEDQAVHIRNDRLKTDYEILLDARKYSDVSQM
ncbi:hypothetical protein [Fibrobacter sp.]|uniref:hypothetical protein n=1 Tax=Fibrobacter sp. TaxID=35828 RepID=UPI00389011B4